MCNPHVKYTSKLKHFVLQPLFYFLRLYLLLVAARRVLLTLEEPTREGAQNRQTCFFRAALALGSYNITPPTLATLHLSCPCDDSTQPRLPLPADADKSRQQHQMGCKIDGTTTNCSNRQIRRKNIAARSETKNMCTSYFPTRWTPALNINLCPLSTDLALLYFISSPLLFQNHDDNHRSYRTA